MSKVLLRDKRNVKAADAIKALRGIGHEISEKEAEEILDFLYLLAKLSVDQYVNDTKDRENRL